MKRLPTNLFNSVRNVHEVDAERAHANLRKSIDLAEAEERIQSEIPSHSSSVLWGLYPGYISAFYSPSSITILRNPIVKPIPAPRRVLAEGDIFQIDQLNIPKNYFLDKVFRDFMTGTVVLEGVELDFDFDFVDLSDRTFLDGTARDIINDDFLFRPKCLPNHSWYFQSSFELENSVESLVRLWNEGQKSIKSINDLREQALTSVTIEGNPLRVGGYSPAIPCLMSLILSCLTMDKSAFAVLAMLFAICALYGAKCNKAYSLYLERPVTLPIRLGLAAWILTLGTSSPSDRGEIITVSSFPGTVRIFCAIILLLDTLIGDINQFVRRRERCAQRLRVRKYITENLIVLETKSVRPMSECLLSARIIGEDLFAEQQDGRGLVLVAYVEGVFCELLPLREADVLDPNMLYRSYCMKVFSS